MFVYFSFNQEIHKLMLCYIRCAHIMWFNSGAFPIKNVPESVRAKRLDPFQPMRDEPVGHVTRDSSLTYSMTGCSSSRTQDAGIPPSARAVQPKPPVSSHRVLSQLLRSCLRVDGQAAAWCHACQTLALPVHN